MTVEQLNQMLNILTKYIKMHLQSDTEWNIIDITSHFVSNIETRINVKINDQWQTFTVDYDPNTQKIKTDIEGSMITQIKHALTKKNLGLKSEVLLYVYNNKDDFETYTITDKFKSLMAYDTTRYHILSIIKQVVPPDKLSNYMELAITTPNKNLENVICTIDKMNWQMA